MAVTTRQSRRQVPGHGEVPVIIYPDPAEVPDWSGPTVALLAALSPVERAFVEWFAAGVSASEAYRRATGRPVDETGAYDRQGGFKLRSRPRVQAALQACLADRNVGARCDRQWVFQKLHLIVERLQESDRISSAAAMIPVIRLIAQLQGELPVGGKRVRLRRPPVAPPLAPPPTAASATLDALRQAARAKSAGRPADPGVEVETGLPTVTRDDAGRPAALVATTPPARSFAGDPVAAPADQAVSPPATETTGPRWVGPTDDWRDRYWTDGGWGSMAGAFLGVRPT